MDIQEILKTMTDYQKGSIKDIYEWNKKGFYRGTRAGKPLERLGLIKYKGHNRYNTEYEVTELGIKIVEHLLLEELAEKEAKLARNPDWVSAKNSLESYRKKLIEYGLI
jgi:predicted transcriptional regulator